MKSFLSRTLRIEAFFRLCIMAAVSAPGVSFAQTSPTSPPVVPPSADFGTEIRKFEENIAGPAAPSEPLPGVADRVRPMLPGAAEVAPSIPQQGGLLLPGVEVRTETFRFDSVKWEGDVALLEQLGLRLPMEQALTSTTMDATSLRAVIDRYNTQLIDMGYFIASIRNSPPVAPEDRVITLQVDQGRVGSMNFYAMPEKEVRGKTRDQPVADKAPYAGKHFSEEQIKLRLRRYIAVNEPFNYLEFRRAVLDVNISPDLTMDTDLKVRREFDPDVRTLVDLDFYIEDKVPLHFAVELNNTGTKETEELRLFLTAQHVNLTKNDDVLTISAPLSFPDVSILQSVSLGYNVPYHAGNGGGLSVFGGYSKLEADEIVPELGLEGTGYFAGVRGFHRLRDTRSTSLNVTMGGTYRSNDDAFVFGNERADEDREVEVLPLSLGIVYSRKDPDSWGGRNFATALAVYNLGDVAGISEEASFNNQRLGAEPDYIIGKLQIARIQAISFGKEDALQRADEKAAKQAYVFARVDAQVASGSLIASEQMAAGGLDNVRGYPERDVAGDHGFIGSIELRSPIYSGWISGLFNAKTLTDKFQFVAFVDGAFLMRDEEDSTLTDEHTLLSVGAGMRLALTQYAQLRLDYGFPLEDSGTIQYKEDVDGTGRVHFSAQVQF